MLFLLHTESVSKSLPDNKISDLSKLSLTSLPDDKILVLSKLKAFADDNFSVVQMGRFFYDRVGNIAGKEENAGFHHFLLFSQCF